MKIIISVVVAVLVVLFSIAWIVIRTAPTECSHCGYLVPRNQQVCPRCKKDMSQEGG